VRSPLYRRTALTLAVLASLAGSACGDNRASTEKSPARVVRVTERDFRISAPDRVSAGDVELLVDNEGPDDHELIVVRAGKTHLPFRADDVTLDEEAAEESKSIAGALEPGEPGTRRLRVHLTPGRYVLFCNMSGHYLGGMDRDLEVQ
jgi:uncharacterized cupredoxin-like copper-binding protein